MPVRLPSLKCSTGLHHGAPFTRAIQNASALYVSQGARVNRKPWALDPELRGAVALRRDARKGVRAADPDSGSGGLPRNIKPRRWSVVTQSHFRSFVSTMLNRPASLGRVSRIRKKLERAADDYRAGEAMLDNGRLLITATEKAE